MAQSIKKRITVSDILTEHVHKWQRGDIITIEAGTGVGKSHFIKHELYPIAKKERSRILFFLNRTRLNEQFREEIKRDGKTDVITIILYQKYEWELLNNKVIVKEDYKYIVCDEFHYFLTESRYNKNTEDSFYAMINEKSKIRICMSATADAMIAFFKYKNIQHASYSIPHDYSHIKELIFYQNSKVLEKFLHQIPKNHKAICFTRSAKKAFKLHDIFKDSMFVCSPSGNASEKKYMNKEQVSKMLIDEKFDEQFVFSTSTLDNGINLRDKQIKYIVADITDVDVLIQCLGRKRIIDKSDKVTVIIKNISNKMLNKLIRDCDRQIEPALYLQEHGTSSYVEKYRKQPNRIVYDRPANNEVGYDKAINDLMFFKEIYDKQFFEQVANEENGYMNYIKTKLQQATYTILDDTYDKADITDYLDTIIGKRLYKEEQAELIKKLNLRDGRDRRLKSYRTINEYFNEDDMPYNIRGKNRDQRRVLENGHINPNYNKTFWLLAKHQCL
ncbi:DEAD/DEAH box helicase family protein [Paenibacillus sp. EKM202P]|uniref:DEAD/DEAH box helicase family protein n=1 Tax=unclassified Paenibacillus TaxID=185978 RepID=UPI0013EA3481|nr:MULTISPECIES: DEAD/DEAH box helicase family protein [unclassified Paenibacillus]KAF6556358.1 DEAD/DEAH box helicase family protein [Paenibacillus sp. EKM202P]KAF6562896.1 DEAD/DEAH box helicase family protein [Paenibacillus sp. EKM207P]